MEMKVNGLIVAAGLSSRALGYKMLYKIEEKTLIEQAVMTIQPFCREVTVVTGHNHELIEKVLKDYQDVRLVYNKKYKEGMFTSVKLGINKMVCDRLIFMPGDYGHIKKRTVKKLLENSGDVIIPSYDYHAGHPIIIKGSLLEEISENLEFSSLKDFVKGKEATYVTVNDPGILMDIDTFEDYLNVLECIKNEN